MRRVAVTFAIAAVLAQATVCEGGGISVTGGGLVPVVEGQSGHLDYRLSYDKKDALGSGKDGPSAIKVSISPALSDFGLPSIVNGDATDVPTLTGTIGLTKGFIIPSGGFADFSIQFSTPKDPPEQGNNGNGGIDPDFGQVNILVKTPGEGNIAAFMDSSGTGGNLFFWRKNPNPPTVAGFPFSSIKVTDIGFVPEPSSWILLGTGAAALIVWRCRRKGQ
jgi:hypothetical protein